MIAAHENLALYGVLANRMSAWVEGREAAPREILVEGPAGTGKTRTILEYLLNYADTYPGSKIVFLRVERAAMSETMLVEWENKVLGPMYPQCIRGQQRRDREKYVLPNGSEFILRGFNDEQKLYSGQYHIIYFNEATELKSEEKWQTLHRSLRAEASGGQPFKAIIADCNPRHKGHWINVRATPKPDGRPAKLYRIKTRFHDNPRWFNHAAGRWTQDAVEDIFKGLRDSTSGPTHDRLFSGLWSDNSGAVLPGWDDAKHWLNAVQRRDGDTILLDVEGWAAPVEIRWCFGAMDAGFENAAVFGVWGMDLKGRIFELAEIYRHHWTHDDWARAIVPIAREFRLQGIVADHDKALIAAVNRALINEHMPPVVRIADKTLGMSGEKGKQARIDLMRSRLQRGELFFLRNVNRFVDEELRDAEPPRPYMTPMELPNLQFEEHKYGEDAIGAAEKVDKRLPDHGFDMTLYGLAFAAGKQAMVSQPQPKYAPGTAGAILNHARYAPKKYVPNRADVRSWLKGA